MSYDAVVVGSGPNGLAAAIRLAQAGWRVRVYEAETTIGGGTRTLPLTLPGFQHDICSAIHPLAVASPYLSTLPLADNGLEWVYPEIPLAHPFDDGSAAILHRSLLFTGESLGCDGAHYQELMHPFVSGWEKIAPTVLGPFRFPRHPFAAARFALSGLRSATGLARSRFQDERALAFFAGLAGHSIMPLDRPGTAGFGLMLGILGHVAGWPFPRGGAQQLAFALGRYLEILGGEIVTGHRVGGLAELPRARAYLFDVAPRQLLTLVGDRFPGRYRRQLQRYRYGPGVCKVDWALREPIPWRAEACRRAGTIHLGGSFAEIVASEQMVWQGWHPERPFTLVAQQSVFDDSRAPEGRHTAWGYCHVPHGSARDATAAIEAQIERFAPGFRDCILARCTHTAIEMAHYNPNYVGGDINTGVQDLRQLFTRPAVRSNPYTTPDPAIYLCSSATPPGGGVHGMCGYHAAETVLRRLG